MLLFQSFLFLSTQWYPEMNSKVAFASSSMSSATHILVKPHQKKYSHRPFSIVPVRRTPKIEFDYLHKRYTEDSGFSKVTYPINLSFSEYLQSRGHSEDSLKLCKKKYEGNLMDLPIPTFSDLMKEHVVAPFFVFQLFCVLLWMMDEYWQLSMYTLAMLIVFESTVVMQRIANWKRIKNMRKPSQKVSVLRCEKIVEISSDLLLPGDILVFSKGQQKITVPCDGLIVDGNCTVDESILTGEAIPQLKEDIRNKEGELDLKRDKASCLMGGTTVLTNTAMKCYVLRTGWDTTQGKLMRKILYSDRVTLDSKEAFAFIGILLCFALAATSYVVYYSYSNENKDKYKLLLKCIIIITSVVPPELPIELALAVNSSILCLQQKSIFCTEPYRLPLTGKATICCFDKTGTLTDQNFEVKGICTDKDPVRIPTNQLACTVIAGCHTLAKVENDLIGDPVEKVSFQAIEGTLSEDFSSFPGTRLKVLSRFAFNSTLKRMSAAVKIEKTGQILAVCKGAPEYLEPLLSKVPDYYQKQLNKLTSEGFRVLTLAYKEMHGSAVHERSELEQNLQFVAFLVLKSPLKPHTEKVIQEIKNSSHQVVMITGDNVFTAAQVALDLHFAEEALFVDYSTGKLRTLNALGQAEPAKASSALCVTGDQLNGILSEPEFFNCKVFARVSPSQKEMIIAKLNERHITIMCGDGTNDVGALKKAHSGISLINKAITQVKTGQNPLTEQQLELGDASMAAHFTSKVSTIKAVKHLIQQGRCTLVTTYQMYRILALNCLFSAYNLSVMYLDGIKFGDTQATVSAFAVSGIFFFVSRSKPMNKLSKFHPPTSVFEAHIIVSVFSQFLVQIAGLLGVNFVCKLYSDDVLPVDQEFKPCLLNSCLYLYTSWIGFVNFLVNYQGEPFMKPIQDNQGLLKCLKIFMGLTLTTLMEITPFGEMIEIVPFPGVQVRFM
jgi:cation-transporting ATPase 13A1